MSNNRPSGEQPKRSLIDEEDDELTGIAKNAKSIDEALEPMRKKRNKALEPIKNEGGEHHQEIVKQKAKEAQALTKEIADEKQRYQRLSETRPAANIFSQPEQPTPKRKEEGSGASPDLSRNQPSIGSSSQSAFKKKKQSPKTMEEAIIGKNQRHK